MNFIAGQGLDEMQIDHLYCLGISCGLDSQFEKWRHSRQTTMANRATCHKHRPENVLISNPEKFEDETFISELTLHRNNELMLDHQTGEHIQGMVLIEACRQMFLAVTETYHLSKFSFDSYYFVINEMTVSYLSFAFPLPTKIHYRLLSSDQSRADRLTVHAEMDIKQNNQVTTKVSVKFAVFDAEKLNTKESQLAERAVHQYLSSFHIQAHKSKSLALLS
jgi:hypothetical protein